ncbi:MAG: hypothetical protein P4L85_27990 [Paludisphaera borealis]|uniref:hypothetical protein n=1 Tax=Paludisphaera borealis TaxID=1387353 RepID=UPI002850F019|nr:hypothetical protein [Paludisphaera borealis]MDR3623227.1 hypothetical protein [Paludisphaera borealis]
MPAIRTTAVGIVAWSVFATSATAAPLSWFGTQATLTAWYANHLNSAGNIYAPTTTVSNLPSDWYTNTTYQAPTATYAAPVANIPTAPAPLAAQTVPAPILTPVSTGSINSSASATTASLAPPVDAFINLGQGPYAEASTITTGSPQPWYTSPTATSVFGGTPTAAQQSSFASQVLSDIQHTFSISGMNISLTDDPSKPAVHMMSVVSGASYGPNPSAIGITDVGANGFGFIDKLNYATTPDQLAWAVAHNISHELMHALGVGTHPDTTGTYLDSAVATWSMLTDPNTKFSPAAVALMQSANNGAGMGSLGSELMKLAHHPANCHCQFCQMMHGLGIDGAQILAAAVPEPSTIAVWIASGLGAGFMVRRRVARKAA